MLAKGLLLITTGHDRSFVPWFGLLASVGLTSAAVGLWCSGAQWRWLAILGAAGAVIGVVASCIAVGYLVTGTIPESPNAPELVGLSYAVSSAGVAVAVVALGVLIVGNRSLTGWWRWLPIGLIMAQLPIFIVAEAVGEGVGSEDLTDGLGLAITGAAWILFGYALSQKQQLDIRNTRP